MLIDAIPVFDELHVTVVVRSWVELSENIPVAVNCWEVPFAIVGLVGVIWIEASVAAVIVSVVDPEILPDRAVIVNLPV